MPAGHIQLQVRRNLGGPIGLGAGAVGFSANEIDGDGEMDVPGQVSEKEKCAGGDPDEDWRFGEVREVGGDLGGEFGDSGGDFVGGPQDALNVRVQRFHACFSDGLRVFAILVGV